MAVGSFASFLADDPVTNTLDNTFELFDPTWTVETNPDSLVSESAGVFTINETGTYLVLYGIDAAISGSSDDRRNGQSRVRHNGTDIPGSYSTAYRRNDANSETMYKCQFIADFNVTDTVDVEWLIADIALPLLSNPFTTFIQFIKLNSSTVAPYGFYTDGTDTQAFDSQTFAAVPWDTTTLESDTNVIEKQAGDTAIRLKEIGRYLVTYSIPLTQGNNVRTQRIAQVTLGGNPINASQSFTYLRNIATPYGAIIGFLLIDNTVANQDLVIQMQEGNADSSGNVSRTIDNSGLVVMKLNDQTNIFISHDSTGGELFNGSSDVTYSAMRTNDVVDPDFASSTINELNILKEMDMLAWGNIFSNRTITPGSAVASNRTGVIRFDISFPPDVGNAVAFGPSANIGAGDTFNVSMMPGAFYFGVLFSDTLQLISSLDGAVGDINQVTVIDQVGFFALNVNTLAASANLSETVSITDDVFALKTFFVGLNESVAISDAVVVKKVAHVVSLNETVAITDSLFVQDAFITALAQTVSISDAIAVQDAFITSLAESVTISDVVAVQDAFIALLPTESLTISDLVAGNKGFFAGLNDSVTITDSVDADSAFFTFLAETVLISDLVDIFKTFVVELNQTVSISDAVAAAKTFFALLQDSVLISDSVDAAKTITVELSETVGITDSVEADSTFLVLLSETVTISGIEVSAKVPEIDVDQFLVISDSVDIFKKFVVPLEETVNITDNVNADSTKFVFLNESVSISGSVETAVQLIIVKTVSSNLCTQSEISEDLCV